ncbi:MAG: ATP-dependent Clp protease ATP-binding subunit [bacterium]|nr:ATP-dependent Clp protease ATP-binding subunit [bacterium]
MDFYNFFSFSAKKAIYRASEICGMFNNQYLEPEHAFYSILNLRSCSAVQVLHQLGINLPKLTYSLEAYLYEHAGSYKGNAVFSQRTISLLDTAYKEVKRLHHREIGTTHLLIALTQDRSAFLRTLFEEHGLDSKKVRDTFMTHLKGYSQGAEGTSRREKDNSVVAKFSRNLTDMARAGELDPVIGREREISRMKHILSKRIKNNPILVGEPGVGKTAIVEGLAQRIVNGDVPPSLADCELLSIALAGLVAGTKFRGEFEERLKQLIKEIQDSKGKTIIFIDELHTILGAGSAEGSLDAGNILKPSLARGELRCIGATTFKEYRKYFEKDGALSRRFQPVFVEEPNYEETMDILRGLRKEYELHHKVQISDAALEQSIRLSQKFIPDRKLPDKAIDLVDEASAWVNLDRESGLLEQNDFEDEGLDISSKLPMAFDPNLQSFEEHTRAIELAGSDDEPIVGEEHIAKVVELWTGIPSQNITMDDQRRLMTLEGTIKDQLIGQNEAVETIVRSLKRNFSGVRKGTRPIGSFIFLGPTGVGKTELAKAIARHVFAHDNAFIKIDLSEYGEKHSASRLIGAPPGYVGYDEGGQLTEAVKRHPYSLVLFDEMEKAHPDVFHTLLQLLDEGVLTDGQGRKVYFHNTIVIFTTNLAGRFFDEGVNIGFGKKVGDLEQEVSEKFESYKHRAEEHLKKYFRPEFLNRLDDTIYFRPLVRENIFSIARLELTYLAQTLEENNRFVSFDDKVVELVVSKGYSPTYGARNIKRAIQKHVEDPLSEMILLGQLPEVPVHLTIEGEGTLAIDFDAGSLDPAGFMPEQEPAGKE